MNAERVLQLKADGICTDCEYDFEKCYKQGYCEYCKEEQMTKQKQIEEMAKVLSTLPLCEIRGARPHTKMVFKLVHIAEHLYTAGYRKQIEGKWIFEHESYGKMLCSNCKEEALVNDCNEYVDSDFCPNCGAKMKGDEGK